MLNSDDKAYVIERLSDHVAPLESPRGTVAAPFIGTTLPQGLRQGYPREVVVDAVRLCLEDGWKHDPPWLVLLLDLIPATIDAKLDAIRERVRQSLRPLPGAVQIDPLDTTILADDMPFFNRTKLRARLRRLATPAGSAKPILVVIGNPKSGKSYSRHYIDHFSYHQPPITTYRFELKEATGLETGPVEIARDLVTMMGLPVTEIPQAMTNQKLYVHNLASWVLGKATQIQTQHWIMLDNFNGPSLRADTRDFIVELSDLVTTGVFAHRCRLILIGFDRTLLTVDPGKVDEEDVDRAPRADIEACIDEIMDKMSPALARQQLVHHVFHDLPNDADRMCETNNRLRELLLAISEVTQIAKSLPGLDIGETLLEVLANLPQGDIYLVELKRRIKELRESAEEI